MKYLLIIFFFTNGEIVSLSVQDREYTLEECKTEISEIHNGVEMNGRKIEAFCVPYIKEHRG